MKEMMDTNPKIKFDTAILDQVTDICPYPDQNLTEDDIFKHDQIKGNHDLWHVHI